MNGLFKVCKGNVMQTIVNILEAVCVLLWHLCWPNFLWLASRWIFFEHHAYLQISGMIDRIILRIRFL